MAQQIYEALVVEDEAVIRQLTMRALNKQGFSCDIATDGAEALELTKTTKYDLVVTDLKMPNMHGHALAVELLSRNDRPVIVVLTGVIEPRLAKDLMHRGVDDIMFKPVDYDVFAAKVRSLMQRMSHEPTATDENSSDLRNNDAASVKPISLDEIQSKLAIVSRIVPISETALEVHEMAKSRECGAEQLANTIQRDAPLATEIIGLANSSFFNPTEERIVEIDLAIARIGQKRVGEMALAASALSALTTELLPWMDVDAAWRRSVAAGIALDLLVMQGQHEDLEEGLLLCAIMHQLGRVVLATLYPDQYQRMVSLCLERNETLLEHENRLFPDNHAKIMSRLATIWKIPAEICRPLRNILDPYPMLTRFPGPARKKAELVKVAVLIGQIAAAHWEPWDLVEFPSSTVIRRLRIDDLAAIIEQTRVDLERILEVRSKSAAHAQEKGNESKSDSETRQLFYRNLSGEPVDFLKDIVSSMNIVLTLPNTDLEECDAGVLFNCQGAAPHQLSTLLRSRPRGEIVLACHAEQLDKFSQMGRAVAVPCSYRTLKSTLMEASQPVAENSDPADNKTHSPHEVSV